MWCFLGTKFTKNSGLWLHLFCYERHLIHFRDIAVFHLVSFCIIICLLSYQFQMPRFIGVLDTKSWAAINMGYRWFFDMLVLISNCYIPRSRMAGSYVDAFSGFSVIFILSSIVVIQVNPPTISESQCLFPCFLESQWILQDHSLRL